MNRKMLQDYRVNKRLIERNKKKILDEQCRDIPIVAGKVAGSSPDYPYIEQRFTVQMDEPVAAEQQRKRILKWEAEIRKAEEENMAVEKFIAGIAEVREREIMTYRYMDGIKVSEIGKMVGYTHGRVSQIISKILKD